MPRNPAYPFHTASVRAVKLKHFTAGVKKSRQSLPPDQNPSITGRKGKGEVQQPNLWGEVERDVLDNVIELPNVQQTKDYRDTVWDAVVEIVGYEPRTRGEAKEFGRITNSLVYAHATPEEIREVKVQWNQTWPHCDLTIWALDKWFGHFLAKARVKLNRPAPCAECGVGGGMHAADCGSLH